MPTIERIDGYAEELTAIRRDMHAHPELGFEEDRTVRHRRRTSWREWGIEVHRGVGNTGVVGVLGQRQRRQARSGCAPTWTPADARRTTDLRYRSTVPRPHARLRP